MLCKLGKFFAFLGMSSSEAGTSRDHLFSGFFCPPDFHELWSFVMSVCLITEVKQQWSTLVFGYVTA